MCGSGERGARSRGRAGRRPTESLRAARIDGMHEEGRTWTPSRESRRGAAYARCSPLDQEDREALRCHPPCRDDTGAGALRSAVQPRTGCNEHVRDEVGRPKQLGSFEGDRRCRHVARSARAGTDAAPVPIVGFIAFGPRRGRLAGASAGGRHIRGCALAGGALPARHRVVRAALARSQDVPVRDVEHREDDQDSGQGTGHRGRAYSPRRPWQARCSGAAVHHAGPRRRERGRFAPLHTTPGRAGMLVGHGRAPCRGATLRNVRVPTSRSRRLLV